MTGSNIAKLKRSSRFKKSLRLITNHRDGDKYDGIILSCNKDMVLLQNDRDFIIDGIIAFPLRSLKGLRMGNFERLRDKIFTKYRLFKKIKKSLWLLKTKNIQEVIRECHRRGIWPIVEAQRKKKVSLFIGPITEVGKSDFCLFAYDAEGRWEKNYLITYKQVFKIELFDTYSKYFNRYMRDKLRTKSK